jgi:hypothetical protein
VGERKILKSFDDRTPDISADERAYQRSIRIRRSVILWLDKNVGRGWNQILDMADDCGNEGKPLPFSSTTAYRWIHQFTATSFAFGLQPDENDNWEIFRRRRLQAADFKRWGIKVPKRFRKK